MVAQEEVVEELLLLTHHLEVVGVHHGTWPPIEIDVESAKGLFKAAGKVLHLPEAGGELGFY